MMQIKHTETESMNCYEFKANGTWYSVGIFKNENDNFHSIAVYSNRFKDSVQGATLKCYNSLNELAKRSKALFNFTKLIQEK